MEDCKLEYLETSHRSFCLTHQRDEDACLKAENGRLQAEMESLNADKELFEKRWCDTTEDCAVLRAEVERLKNNEIAEGDGIAFLREELRQSNLEIAGMRELLSQFRDNLHLHEHLATVAVEECPQPPCQKVMRYMEKLKQDCTQCHVVNGMHEAGCCFEKSKGECVVEHGICKTHGAFAEECAKKRSQEPPKFCSRCGAEFSQPSAMLPCEVCHGQA